MTATTSRRTYDHLYRLLAVALVLAAAVVAFLIYNGSAAAPAAGGDRQITVSITGGRVTPPTGRVEVTKGTAITITVTSDVPDELHVHGYDQKATLAAGTPATVRFRADTTGLFEVETHSAHMVLFQLVVR